MSPHQQQVALQSNLGGGWVARSAEFQDRLSSIVLVTVERGDERRRLRLDLGKAMFLDEAPREIEPGAPRDLTSAIAQQAAPVITNPRG
jgi:hypothetical protein